MLTMKQFRAITPDSWKEVYSYAGKVNRFKTFASEACPGLAVTHDFKKGRPTRITYTIRGKRTDSPSQAIKWFNQVEKRNNNAERGEETRAQEILHGKNVP